MNNRKTFLFYFGHPAQFLFAKNTIQLLQEQSHRVIILLKTKDVLEDLVKAEGFSYENIHTQTRGNSKMAIAFSLLKRMRSILPYVRKYKPDVMVSTDASTAILGKIFSIKNISITEDDFSIVKYLAYLSYPFSYTIFCPNVTDVGPFKKKKYGYNGYMKLAYLHPNYFTPNPIVIEKYSIKKPYILIRLAKLNAFHDTGIKGMSEPLIDTIIEMAQAKNFNIYMSIEGTIPTKYKPYNLNIDPKDLHTILYHAQMLISDSQSMSVEASMLGIPNIRYSSFVGRISVLEELEEKYKLTKGIKLIPIELLQTVEEYIQQEDLLETFTKRKNRMLSEKVDVTQIFYSLVSQI